MMKKLSLAIGTAALVALSALSAPAQAQPHHGHPGYRPQVIVVQPPPPPRHVVRHGHHPRYDRHHHQRYDRHDRRHRAGYRDNDRDGVPNRYDSRPNNPYRN